MTDPTIPPSSPNPPQPVDYGSFGPPSQDAKNLAGISHFLNFIFLVPLIIYLTQKDKDAFVKQQSAEALNFTLTCLIIHVVCSATAMFCIPAIVSLVLFIVQIVLGIMGGLQAKEGKPYKYPASIPMIS